MPGRIKIQGSSLKYIDANGQTWEYPSGASTTISSGPTGAGALFTSGNYLAYTTSSGQRRRILDYSNHGSSSRGAGAIRVSGTQLRYTTSSTERRPFYHDDRSHDDSSYYDHWDRHTDIDHTDSHTDRTGHPGWHTDQGHRDYHNDHLPRDHVDRYTDNHTDVPHLDQPSGIHHDGPYSDGYDDHLDDWYSDGYDDWTWHSDYYFSDHTDIPHQDNGGYSDVNRYDDYTDVRADYPIRSSW